METLQRTANRGSISTGYEIDNSLKIEADNAERIQRASSDIGTPTSTQIATMSFWLKRTELASGNHFVFVGNAGANYNWVGFNNNNLYIYGGTSAIGLRSTAVFRDTSAWYHIVVAYDTTQSTASNRVKAYVNGVQITAWGVQEDYGTQNNAIGLYDVNLNHYLGWSDAQSQSGYYAEFYLIDGQQLAPTEFGEFDSDTGIWIPKEYTGTFGNEGYYLDFEDSSNLGLDVSGNSNNFGSLINISAADQAVDTPTNNFATGNNLVRFTNPSSTVVTDGATLMTKGANGWETISGTIYVTKGKWYCEVQSILNSNTTAHCSVMPDDSPIISAGGQISNYAGSQSGDGGVSYYANNGNKYLDGGNSSYGDHWKSGSGLGDIMGIALDMDNGKVYFAKANVWQNSGDPTSGATGTGAIDLPSPTKAYTMACAIYANNNSIAINYGGYTYTTISSGASDANGYGTFEYAPPSGYYAICTKNLAEYG